MKKNEIKKGRFISNKSFLESIDNGNLDNLFKYLSENRKKYNLTIRDNKITLYCHGRKLDITKNKKNYKIMFDLNNATKFELEKLDNLIIFLKDYYFDASKYDNWKNKQKNSNKMIALIPIENIKSYHFETVLNKLYDIFESYKDERKEESFKQEFTYTYDNSNNEYIVFDTEYEHSFDTLKEKKQAGKTVKADLIALKKENDKYKVIFIELKENINASVNGNKSNIGDHIVDTINFKKLYDANVKEKERFKRYVEYNLKFKEKHKLLDITNIDYLIKNIDFSEAPDIMIVCGFEKETKEKLKERLKSRFESNSKYKNYKNWDNIIIVGEKKPNILLNQGTKINEFLKD